ncbi:MAG TPA: ABC transporter permease [Anaerolinea sp.]|nr:ABC transporter permease [Anaerolinea sp.]
MGKFIKISWRNLWRNWRRTMIATAAIALGLVFLVYLDGVIAGSREAIYGNLIKLLGGNIQVHAQGYFEKQKRMPLLPIPDVDAVVQAAQSRPEVVGVAQRIVTGGFLSNRDISMPVSISGIEPEKEAPVGLIAGNISAGRYLQATDQDEVLIGKTLADRLGVSLGDRVSLVGRGTHEQMRTRTMTVVGVYEIGSAETEKRNVYISLSEAQSLYGLEGQATEVVVAMNSVGNEAPVVAALSAALPNVEVASWMDLNPALLNTYALGEQMISIFGVIVLLIAAIGILNLMLMAVFERTREIGLLGALGLKRLQIMGLFLMEGTWIGVIGAVIGVVLGGIAILATIQAGGFDLSSMNEAGQATALMGNKLYPLLELGSLGTRVLTVIIIAALASLYPSWQAAHREPAEALHFV